MEIKKCVLEFIKKHNMIDRGGSVVVCVSGGLDSVCLLHILLELRGELCITLTACHLHHGIRGKEADDDASFVRALCKSLDVPLTLKAVSVPPMAKNMGESVEMAARRERYKFFEEVRGDTGAKLAVAHNLNDNTETVLLNLIRGTGLAGLCGIPPVRGYIIRPILCLERTELETYARDNGISFVTDSTNLSNEYTRNKIRNVIMPVLQEINPSVNSTLERMVSVLREEDGLLTNLAAEMVSRAALPCGYDVRELLSGGDAAMRRAVLVILRDNGISVGGRRIELVCKMIKSGTGALDAGDNKRITVNNSSLRVLCPSNKHLN